MADFFSKSLRTFSVGGCVYLCFYITNTIYYETKLKKIEQKKRNIEQRCEKYEESEKDKSIYQYMDQHYGNRLLQQIQVRENIQTNVQTQLNQKNQLRSQLLKENNVQQVEQLEKEIDALNLLFTSVRPKVKYFNQQSD